MNRGNRCRECDASFEGYDGSAKELHYIRHVLNTIADYLKPKPYVLRDTGPK